MVTDSGTIILIKGVSGSGKSTRVYCFLDFLESIGMKLKPYQFVNILGQTQEIGLYSEELNMLFLGKFYDDNGVRRWQGLDAVTGRLHTAEGLSYFLKWAGQRKLNVVLEGAGTSVTWRLRPMEICAEYEFLNILYLVYTFKLEQYDDYVRRIEYRSGKAPKSDAMWRKRKGFESDYAQTVIEAKDLNSVGADIVIKYNLFDAVPWDLGTSIMQYFGLDELCDEFRQFVENGGYIEQNSFENISK
jgi:hypothetical protein